MVNNRLHILMAEKRIKSVRELSEATGISLTTLYRIYNGENTRIDYNTISVLCLYLDCTIGDLMEFIPDKPHEEGDTNDLH